MSFHVDVEAEILEGLWELSELQQDAEFYPQVSLDEAGTELPVDVVIDPYYVSQDPDDPEVRDKIPKLPSSAEFRCKVLVPSYFAGALIGKRGKNMHRFQQLTQSNMNMSGVDVFFPGTQDRMLTIVAATKISFAFALHTVVLEMLKAWTGCTQANQNFVLKLVVPDSAAGRILGLGGAHLTEIQTTTGCRINISRRNKGIKERVVVLMDGKSEVLVQGAVAVLDCIQNDPHLQEYMNFKYTVELPLGSWHCGKLGPAEPDAVLIPLERARVLPKRQILENLAKAAPKEILIRRGMLGNIKKLLKMKTHEAVLAALEEAWGSTPEQSGRVSCWEEGPNGTLPVGLQP